MKNYLFDIIAVIMSIFMAGVSVSCGNDDEMEPQQEQDLNMATLYAGLKEYLQSDDHALFLQQNGLSAENVNINTIQKDSFPTQHVDIYTLHIEKGSKTTGRLYVLSKNEGETYRTIYEDLSNTDDTMSTGFVTISTGTGNFLAEVEINRTDGVLHSKITRIPGSNKRASKSNEESWWECTKRVYRIAKESCEGSDNCGILCDMIDAVNAQCTISIAAAAAIVCI